MFLIGVYRALPAGGRLRAAATGWGGRGRPLTEAFKYPVGLTGHLSAGGYFQ